MRNIGTVMYRYSLPTVGKPNNNELHAGEKTYPMKQHGCTRDALMFEGDQVAEAVLCDKEGSPVLGVSCPQAEAYGIVYFGDDVYFYEPALFV